MDICIIVFYSIDNLNVIKLVYYFGSYSRYNKIVFSLIIFI